MFYERFFGNCKPLLDPLESYEAAPRATAGVANYHILSYSGPAVSFGKTRSCVLICIYI